jgi:hypothetical protein
LSTTGLLKHLKQPVWLTLTSTIEL